MEHFSIFSAGRGGSTLEREIAPFGGIRDSHSKYLLTLDEAPADNLGGIRKLNVLERLLR